jgi:capsular exopolysaccharide synthesis family protein
VEYANRKTPPLGRLMGWLSFRRPDENAEPPSWDAQIASSARWISSRLRVEPVRNSHLVRIRVMDRSPVLARDVANAVCDAYTEFNWSEKSGTTEGASDFLAAQVERLREEVGEAERQLQEYSADKEILAIRDKTQDISSEALADLNARFVRARSDLALAGARFDSLEGVSPGALPEVLNSPLINELKREYADSERRYTQMSERFKADWPELRNLEQELRRSRERLEVESQIIASQVREAARADLERARAEVAALEAEVEIQKRTVRKVSRDAVEFEALKAEIETRRKFLNELVNRQSQTTVSQQMSEPTASNVRIVDKAVVPKYPIRPRKFLNFLLAIMIGSGLGVAAAFLLDYLDNTVKSEADVEAVGGVRVLGHIPVHSPLKLMKSESADVPPDSRNPDLASFWEPRSVFAESFRTLRTSILLASPEHPPRSILITSCEPGDGKSLVAVNLAVVLTQLGRRVLLVDADLRRPRLHRVFGVENAVGLSSYLTGNAEFDEIIHSTDVPSLDFLSSGPIPPTPAELLDSARLSMLLTRVLDEGRFDHVIFDSPPSVHVTDAVLLSAKMDATMLVVRWEKTSRGALASGTERFKNARAHLVGAVLNGVEERGSYSYTRYAYEPTDTDSGARRTVRRRVSSSRKTRAKGA